MSATPRARAPAPLRPPTRAGGGGGARPPQDRVLVITWWDAPYDAELPELPEPGEGLAARAVHRWRFESVG
ncbi:hypothetical protein [Streptomyces sp. NPDC059010]|uniref:hypothetical protein n=1 Tax=Streptomyces sp. NPDC059010 TaxID=3346695 RepID=UPI00368164D5